MAAVIPFGTRRTRRFIPWLSIALPALGWLTFGLYPSFATIYYSLTQYSGLPGTALDFCGFCNYKDAFTTLLPQVGDTVRITIEFAVGVTVIQNVVALALALLLNREGRMFGFYQALIFMPEILSVTVVGAIFSLLFDPFSGPIEPLWRAVFHNTSAFFGSYYLALPLVIAVQIWMFTGYSMLIYIAGLRNIPSDLYEAAAIDGANRWQAFLRVTWPLLASATTVNIFLAVIGSLSEYALTLVLTNGKFGTLTVGLYMFQSAFGQNSQLGYGSMLAMLQFFITVIVGGSVLILLRRRELAW
jgi:raffinose/stachyose/melibiose transport system permease protein